MPLTAYLRVCLRRWYVVLVGLALTLATTYAVLEREGVYYSEVQVVLVGPPQISYPNTVAVQPFSLAPMASLLVSDWNGTRRPLLTSASDTTLYGEGVRDGTQVRLPNQGSQFKPSFDAPYVDVQVVGPSEAEVTAEAKRVVDQLRFMLQRRQEFAGVPTSSQITTLLAPEDVSATHVAARSTRAGAVTFALGLVGTALLAAGAERLLSRSRERRARPAEMLQASPSA
ncbi:hypothetical protein GCM10022197_40890 [Microlunatus spumicola]|uniref:Capsular polysaccharide biosynthesis protein n=1 Tax=Microlunatus spumicola TaxID=81499 RepID=A0ABP6YA96_9ACTN